MNRIMNRINNWELRRAEAVPWKGLRSKFVRGEVFILLNLFNYLEGSSGPGEKGGVLLIIPIFLILLIF